MIALAGLLVGLAWINGQGIETDIRRAFGVTATDDVDRWLEDQTAASLGETMVLLGHAERDQLRVAVRAAREFVDSSEVLQRQPWARPPPADSLLAHRGHLLSAGDWQRVQHAAASSMAAEALRRLYAPTGMASSLGFDADPFGTLGRFASSRWPDAGFELDGDIPIKAGQGVDWAVLRLSTGAQTFGLEGARHTVAALDALAAAVTAVVADARYLDLSVSRHTDRAAEQSKREMSRIGVLSIIAITLLLGWLFRHPGPLVLTVLSIASGMLIGFAAVSLLFPRLHLIAMVFGAALIGIAVDYALHLLIAPGDGQQRLRAVMPGISLGLLTTCVAFAGLLMAPFESLRQVAVFAMFGLGGACLTVFCVLPRWLRADGLKPREAGLEFAERLLAGRPKSDRWAVLWIVGLLGVGAAGLLQLQTRDDLRAMYFSPPELIAQARTVRAIVGGWDASQMLVVRAAERQSLLESLERLEPGLDDLKRRGVLRDYLHVARSLPSQRRQQLVHDRLDALVYAPGQALDQLAADLNAPDTWAQSRRAAFNDSTPLRFDGWREDMAGTPYPDLIAPLADAWVGLVRVSDVGDVEAVVQWAAAQRASGVDVRWRDTIAGAQRQLAAARQGAARVLVLAAAAVLLVLGLRYGTRGAVTVALPSLLAVVGTLGLCGWLGQPFTVFRLFALLLVIGLSIDYAVFAREAGSHASPTLLAIALSALTTLLSFGLLGLSSTPALAEFGSTVVLGVVIALASTWLLWRRQGVAA